MDLSNIPALLGKNEIVSTAILIVAATATRLGAKYLLHQHADIQADQRRRILANLRNAIYFILIIGLAMIWAPALRTFALSLTAFAVAFIVATKELILCVSGSIIKTASSAMKIGSWVEVAGMRGEVTDQTVLTTTLQELGTGARTYEFTGRTIVIPNSAFLTNPVKNERFFARYVVHEFFMVIDARIDPEPVIEAMLKTMEKETAPHQDAARRYEELIESTAGVDIPSPHPTARIATMNDARQKITVSCLLPTKNAVAIEQAAMFSGLAAARQGLEAAEKSARSGTSSPQAGPEPSVTP